MNQVHLMIFDNVLDNYLQFYHQKYFEQIILNIQQIDDMHLILLHHHQSNELVYYYVILQNLVELFHQYQNHSDVLHQKLLEKQLKINFVN
jgi:hypothetical protein